MSLLIGVLCQEVDVGGGLSGVMYFSDVSFLMDSYGHMLLYNLGIFLCLFF